MGQWQYSATSDAVAEMLDGGGEFQEPAKILQDLTEVQAAIIPPGSPHSIAQILAHTQFYQDRTLAHLRGDDRPKPAHLDDTFAAPEVGAWPDLIADFLAGIAEAKRVAAEQAETTSPDRDDTNVCYDLAESALHNAYHLGQIVLLRQMQGLWPPSGGDANDF